LPRPGSRAPRSSCVSAPRRETGRWRSWVRSAVSACRCLWGRCSGVSGPTVCPANDGRRGQRATWRLCRRQRRPAHRRRIPPSAQALRPFDRLRATQALRLAQYGTQHIAQGNVQCVALRHRDGNCARPQILRPDGIGAQDDSRVWGTLSTGVKTDPGAMCVPPIPGFAGEIYDNRLFPVSGASRGVRAGRQAVAPTRPASIPVHGYAAVRQTISPAGRDTLLRFWNLSGAEWACLGCHPAAEPEFV